MNYKKRGEHLLSFFAVRASRYMVSWMLDDDERSISPWRESNRFYVQLGIPGGRLSPSRLFVLLLTRLFLF